jgi:selenide,water dikinase
VAVVGGHTIEDREPKYGLAVTGVVDPAELITNASGQPGDALVLTKPLGTGAVSTALKKGFAPDDVTAAAVAVMCELNAAAAQAARAAGAHAMTDVTGFGLLGHLHELTLASGLAAEVDAAAVPAIAGALELLGDDRALAGGSRKNRRHAETFATFDADVDEVRRRLVCDAMTSGGLLIALPAERASELPGVMIGRLVAGEAGTIAVRS